MRILRVQRGCLRALALGFFVAISTPGLVYGHGGSADGPEAVLDPLSAVWAGITVQLRHSLAPQVLIEHRGDGELQVLDAGDRPFLRISADAVHADMAAAAWYNTYSVAGLEVPPEARDPQAPARWVKVRDEGSWGWFDPRLSPDTETGSAPLDAQRWAIPVRLDGRDDTLQGGFRTRNALTRDWRGQLAGSSRLADGLSVRLIPGPVDGLMLRNQAEQPVTVFGLEGEPFLRISARQVEANLRSRTWREWGRSGEMDVAPGDGAAWQRIAASGTYTWLEPRSRPQAPDAPGPEHRWQVPLMLGESLLSVQGLSQRITEGTSPPHDGEGHADMDHSSMDHAAMEHGVRDHENHPGQAHAGAHHDHDVPVEASAPYPSVRLRASPDAMSGWNIEILTDNFRFTPERVNLDNVSNQGHAHIYLNGVKLARLYGRWYHLPAPAPGEHRIRVTLNANSHAPWSRDGRPITGEILITQP